MSMSRRRFVQTATSLVAAGAALGPTGKGSAAPIAAPRQDVSLQGRIYKTLKIGMVNVPGSLTDKFQAVKKAGFDGIEMDSPGMNVEETLTAIRESGLPVDGTVCSTHWGVRHTDPNPDVRKQALADLERALQDTHAVGGHTTLLVVGHGNDGPVDEIWPRAIENISQAIPLASRLGVVIAIENVWNHFLYDHSGGSDQTADQYVKFVDELASPWVGMQFDIGNHWKYGSMGDWIRQLGRRVVKLDIKGFSRANDSFERISEGDIDYEDVRAALREINFIGWCAAEVAGGDFDALAFISKELDQAFRLQG